MCYIVMLYAGFLNKILNRTLAKPAVILCGKSLYLTKLHVEVSTHSVDSNELVLVEWHPPWQLLIPFRNIKSTVQL